MIGTIEKTWIMWCGVDNMIFLRIAKSDVDNGGFVQPGFSFSYESNRTSHPSLHTDSEDLRFESPCWFPQCDRFHGLEPEAFPRSLAATYSYSFDNRYSICRTGLVPIFRQE